jgi:hypothetical protein
MPRLEGSFVSVGISILLKNLISQTNDTNNSVILNMLHNGFVEDKTGGENYKYDTFIRYYKIDENIENDYELIDYIKDQLTCRGLIEKELLIPIKNILTLDRNKTDLVCVPLDFDLSVDLSPYKDIENYKKVFIVKK